jgi:hypothetical protein
MATTLDVVGLAKRVKWALVISVIAAAGAVTTFLITLNNYWRSQRPFVGLTDEPVPHLGNPANRFGWSFILMNSGPIPARVELQQKARIQRGGHVEDIALASLGTSQIILMPQQRIDVDGDAIHVPPNEVLSALAAGTATLEVEHTIRYWPTASAILFPAGSYTYHSLYVFDPTASPPTFRMKGGKAN